MTDHHDELASAYLDGQLSPDEAARVEADPSLLARADALASVVERLQAEEAPVAPGARGRHLASALDAFDQLGPGIGDPAGTEGADGTAPLAGVIDLSEAGQRRPVLEGDVARRTARVASSRSAGGDATAPIRLDHRRRRTMPTWLSAAAGLVIIGGGLAWFASQQSRDETSSASFDTGAVLTTVAGQPAAADAEIDQATGDGRASAAAPAGGAGSTAIKSAGSDGTEVADNSASAEAAASSSGASTLAPAVPPASAATAPPSTATSTTRAPATTTTRPLSTPVTTPPGGALSFTSAPTGEQVRTRVASSGQALLPTASSACGASVTPPAGASPSGYVAITVAGVLGEGLFYQGGSGGAGTTTVLVVRSSTCQPFS